MKIVTGVAWPIVVIVAVLVLRKQIGRLIERMTHFKGPGGVEADFPSQAAATNELSAEAVPNAATEMTLPAAAEPEQGLTPPMALTLDDLLAESDTHPVGAVVRSWILVEQVAQHGFGEEELKHGGVRGLVRRLRDAGRMSDDVYGLTNRLSELRNRVVHGNYIPDAASARDFAEAAWRLAIALSNAFPAP